MLDTSQLLDHWGYAAIFGVVVLGNLGLPLPEEGVLVLAGYLVWAGRLSLAPVIITGIISAVIGDNLGYWFGRHYGQTAIQRYGHKLLITPKRLAKAQNFVSRYGSYGVFGARFLPGLRFMAGPLAGSAGMSFSKFFLANALGGLIYVPAAVMVGYLVAQGLSQTIRDIRFLAREIERLAPVLIILAGAIIVIWRALSSRYAARKYPES
ncbi:MAG: DedA family protein [Candidatus Binatia bacterium]